MRGPASTEHDPGATLPLDLLVPSAANPRRSFDSQADAELLESIRARGILTPILVRPLHDAGAGLPVSYEIVAGHRRFAAARELGFNDVPVTIRDLTDDQAREVAIIENLQREDLAPLDEAESYQKLLARPGETPSTVAAKVGKSPAYVGRRLRLLDCILDVREALREGRLDVARAELLAKLAPAVQETALDDDYVWSRIFDMRDDDPTEGAERGWQTADNLAPLCDLRTWVKQHTALNLRDLAEDAETRELFPEAAEAMDAALLAKGAGTGGEVLPTLLEVALGRFQQSPRKEDIPVGVLVLGKHFRQVIGKACPHAEKAVVVFGELRGEVVTVCRAKKACQTHWPPKEKKPVGAKAASSGAGAPRQSWEQQEAERKRRQTIFDRVKPDLVKAIVAATAKVQTTPKLLQKILESTFFDQVTPTLNVVGKLTPATFGRAYTLAEALSGLYNERGAEDVLADLKVKFDLKKAMTAAEASTKTETDAKVKAPGLAKQKADRARATAATKKPASAKKPRLKPRAAATKAAATPAKPKKARAA